MTRRRVFLSVLLVAIILLCIGGWLGTRPEPIQRGMTRDQVEAMFGPPDGRMLEIDGKAIEDLVLVWKDRGVTVEFDKENRVRQVSRPPSFFENLRGKFGF